ncbi:MAG: VOC family protein [Hyphomicrobiales bacterium]
MTLPIPTLDHVVVNARDLMGEAAACYERLGFTLTPRGRHTLGSINHLAMFGTDYLELIGVEPGGASPRAADILRFPLGLNGLVFGTEDSLATHAALQAAGLPVAEPVEFSRPVALPQGSEAARFRTVQLKPQAVPYGRVYFCHHFTRHLVWRDEWRRHRNGTIGIARVVICAAQPAETAKPYQAMFGADAVRAIAGGFSLAVGLSRIDILSPAALASELGDAASDPQGRGTYMAALTLRTLALDRAAGALREGGVTTVQRSSGQLVVPATEAFGAAIAFIE